MRRRETGAYSLIPPKVMIAPQLSATDGFVIAMLAMMVLSLGIIAALLLSMRRNAARRDRQIDELLEEIEEEEKREKPAAPAPRDVATREPNREPWEKDGDWWKSYSGGCE
jgi:hypothetical protein